MKGIAELEFIISVFVFITTISFVTFLIINNIPILHSASVSDGLKSRSYQYSELLLFDEGAPMNWENDPQSADRIGLSNGRRYFADKDKIDASLCFDYQLAKEKLALQKEDIVIEVSYLDGAAVSGSSAAICKPPVTTQLRSQFQITRFGVLPLPAGTYVVKIKVTIIGD